MAALAKSQAALMMTQKLAGRSNGEIANLFNCTTQTVRKRLSMPELQAYFDTAKEVVATKLLPLAIEVAHEKMEIDRDGEMATKVMFGTGLLTHNARIDAHVQAEIREESFDEWRKKRLILQEGTVEAKGPTDPQ